jgi:hypothetical protein
VDYLTRIFKWNGANFLVPSLHFASLIIKHKR